MIVNTDPQIEQLFLDQAVTDARYVVIEPPPKGLCFYIVMP